MSLQLNYDKNVQLGQLTVSGRNANLEESRPCTEIRRFIPGVSLWMTPTTEHSLFIITLTACNIQFRFELSYSRFDKSKNPQMQNWDRVRPLDTTKLTLTSEMLRTILHYVIRTYVLQWLRSHRSMTYPRE